MQKYKLLIRRNVLFAKILEIKLNQTIRLLFIFKWAKSSKSQYENSIKHFTKRSKRENLNNDSAGGIISKNA